MKDNKLKLSKRTCIKKVQNTESDYSQTRIILSKAFKEVEEQTKKVEKDKISSSIFAYRLDPCC